MTRDQIVTLARRIALDLGFDRAWHYLRAIGRTAIEAAAALRGLAFIGAPHGAAA